MAVNSVSTAQAVNLLESRGNRAELRAQEARQAQRVDQTERGDKSAEQLKNRVERNADAARTRAQASDDATTRQRREVEAADQKADAERRRNAGATIGSRINTTA
jgi:hypothetical protein